MANVKLEKVCKKYDKEVTAVCDFSLDIEDKEFVVLVGPSGCGKSTTLRMITGLEDITDGELYIDGKLVNDMEPKDRDIAMVFQNYALYPHMSVYDNMGFALKLRKTPKDEIRDKVMEAAAILGIEHLLDRKPKQLSGGERQRVAIGRAIVRHPKVFLMDEPLSNLDAKMRTQMRAEIIKLHKRIDTTFIYVTHDQVEAMTLGDRIVVMNDGYIQQIDTPKNIFDRPANIFVAGFIGTPQMNFFHDSALEIEDGRYFVTLYGKKFELGEGKQSALKRNQVSPQSVTAGVRPDDIEITGDAKDGIAAVVEIDEMMGTEVLVHVKIRKQQGASGQTSNSSHAADTNRGDAWDSAVIKLRTGSFDDEGTIFISPSNDDINLFDKETGLNLCC